MYASEVVFQNLLEGAKQYIVPVYQRPYVWGPLEIGQLLTDVVDLALRRRDDPSARCFLGPIVLAPTPYAVGASVHRQLLLDGQQRLVTLTLLLAAIRDRYSAADERRCADRLTYEFLVNQWLVDDRFKLIPTSADCEAYRYCIDGKDVRHGSLVGAALKHLVSLLDELDDPEAPVDVRAVEEAVTRGITFLAITCGPDDSPRSILSSLTNFGRLPGQGAGGCAELHQRVNANCRARLRESEWNAEESVSEDPGDVASALSRAEPRAIDRDGGMVGVETEGALEGTASTHVPSEGEGDFLQRLGVAHSSSVEAAVRRLLAFWVDQGGALQFINARSDSCLLRWPLSESHFSCPLIMYANGLGEVALSSLRAWPPFDDLANRQRLRDRFNETPGITLPRGAENSWPSFSLAVLGDEAGYRGVTEALSWFIQLHSDAPNPAPVDAEANRGNALAVAWARARDAGVTQAQFITDMIAGGATKGSATAAASAVNGSGWTDAQVIAADGAGVRTANTVRQLSNIAEDVKTILTVAQGQASMSPVGGKSVTERVSRLAKIHRDIMATVDGGKEVDLTFARKLRDEARSL